MEGGTNMVTKPISVTAAAVTAPTDYTTFILIGLVAIVAAGGIAFVFLRKKKS